MVDKQKNKPFAFISYSSNDIEDVRQIRGFLADKGLRTWIAEEDIPAGADHAEEIPNAIENCDAFILILSQSAQESSWIPKELDSAITAKKLIIPFHIDDSQLKKSFDYRLKDTQIMTAYRRQGDACADLARKLCGVWSIPYKEDKHVDDEVLATFDLPFLNTLVCQRLSSDPANKRLVRDFQSKQNQSLEYYLRELGWKEDSDGDSSVYLIKNQNDQILMYFTLRCGELHEALDVKELVRKSAKLKRLLTILHFQPQTDEEQEALMQAEKYYQMQGEQLMRKVNREYRMNENSIHALHDDWKISLNPNILQVSRTYPAVELAQFAINDKASDFWIEFMKQYHFSRHMGEVLFWRFIVPVICRVQDAAGCSYVYTFVADEMADRSLTKYMQYRLNFQQSDDVGVCKSMYYFGCEFMYQRIDALKQRRRTYFDQLYNELQ